MNEGTLTMAGRIALLIVIARESLGNRYRMDH